MAVFRILHVQPDSSYLHEFLDFVIPQYRDFKIGTFVYSRFRPLDRNVADLSRIGFAECDDTPGRFEIQLAEA